MVSSFLLVWRTGWVRRSSVCVYSQGFFLKKTNSNLELVSQQGLDWDLKIPASWVNPYLSPGQQCWRPHFLNPKSLGLLVTFLPRRMTPGNHATNILWFLHFLQWGPVHSLWLLPLIGMDSLRKWRQTVIWNFLRLFYLAESKWQALCLRVNWKIIGTECLTICIVNCLEPWQFTINKW